jgi:hypothetical protein
MRMGFPRRPPPPESLMPAAAPAAALESMIHNEHA